MTVPNRIHLPL